MDHSRTKRIQRPDPEQLTRLSVVAALPESDSRYLATVSELGHYRKIDTIDWQNRGDVVLGMLAGVVDVSVQSADWKVLPLREIGSGNVLELPEGGLSGIETTVVTAVSARAQVVLIPGELFEEIVTGCQPAVQLLLAEQKLWLRELGGLAANGMYYDPRIRIRHELWRATHGEAGRSVTFEQEYLAERTHTTQATVSRELGRLASEEIIAYEPTEHKATSLDPDRLRGEE